MMMTAYFDETGHSRDPKSTYVGMAGLITSAYQWGTFEEEWRQFLELHQVSELHMKDFAHFQGEFKGWSELKRRHFMREALEIIRNADCMPLASIVDMRAFKALGPRVQVAWKDPYYMSLQICVHGALVYAAYEPPQDKVTLVFDKPEEYAAVAGALVELFREGHEFGKRLGTYSFARARDLLPLQAADLVAYEVGHHLENRLRRPHLRPRWGLQKLVEHSVRKQEIHWFRVWDAEALKSEEKRLLKDIERRENDGEESPLRQ